jgi:hypothetical protein
MRRGKILTLRWFPICNGFVYLEKTTREIPINEDLEAVLKGILKEQGLTSETVLTYN